MDPHCGPIQTFRVLIQFFNNHYLMFIPLLSQAFKGNIPSFRTKWKTYGQGYFATRKTKIGQPVLEIWSTFKKVYKCYTNSHNISSLNIQLRRPKRAGKPNLSETFMHCWFFFWKKLLIMLKIVHIFAEICLKCSNTADRLYN